MLKFISNSIENIKEKPDYVKKRYAWFFTLLITIVIGAVWITGLGDKFKADADLFKSFYDDNSNSDPVEIIEGSADNIESILDGTQDGSTAQNPFDDSNSPNVSDGEARLPQDGSTTNNDTNASDDTNDDVIKEDPSALEDIENFDDYSDEEIEDYLKQKEKDFKQQMEEDLGGGQLP